MGRCKTQPHGVSTTPDRQQDSAWALGSSIPGRETSCRSGFSEAYVLFDSDFELLPPSRRQMNAQYGEVRELYDKVSLMNPPATRETCLALFKPYVL